MDTPTNNTKHKKTGKNCHIPHKILKNNNLNSNSLRLGRSKKPYLPRGCRKMPLPGTRLDKWPNPDYDVSHKMAQFDIICRNNPCKRCHIMVMLPD